MTAKWAEFTFAELIKGGALEIGDGYRAKLSEMGGDGPIFLRAGHVRDTHIDFEAVDRFDARLLETVSSKMSCPGDVVITTKGNSTGRVAFVDKNMPAFVYSPHLSYWRSRDEKIVIPGFLRYWSRSRFFRDQLTALASSTDMAPYLSLVDQRRLRILLPGPDEQRAIADILGMLDDKIELNRRMNETLEAIASASFKSWFVKRTMVGSTSLDVIADFLNGLALQKFPPTGDGDLPVIKIAELRRGDTRGSDLASGNVPPEYVVQDGDVIFSWSGSLEVVIWCGGKGALNQHLFKVTSRKYPKWFYYFWIREHLEGFQAIAASKATTMGHIQRHHLTEAQVGVPSDEVLKKGDALIGPLLNSIVINNLESRTLAALRDALLPKLISGALRVEAKKDS